MSFNMLIDYDSMKHTTVVIEFDKPEIKYKTLMKREHPTAKLLF